MVFENANDEEEFFYIAVRGNRMPAFKRALEGGGFFPEDYGFILEQGKGEASELLKEKMSLQFGCDHQNAIRLLNKHKRRHKKEKEAKKLKNRNAER